MNAESKLPGFSASPPTACSASCFVAGIVKGLIENGDPCIHFGSLLAFDTHVRQAVELGVVAGDIHDLKVTDLGHKAYAEWDIIAESGRSYMWNRKSFIMPNH